jgi:hypothetical protein
MSSILPRFEFEEPPLAEDLAECLRQLDGVDIDVKNLLAGLSESQFHWSPDAARWSIAQCMVHLIMVGRRFIPIIDEAGDNARADRWLSRGPFRYGFLERWFVSSTEPPPKIRLRTPAFARPPDDHPLVNVISDFLFMHEELRIHIRAANGIDLARAKITSPFMRSLKLSLGQSFAFLAAHERRHVWQAWELRKHPEFPAG